MTELTPSKKETGRVLLIAFHYPPAAISSGSLRTIAFKSYLPTFGWKPYVLTAHPRAHERIDLNSSFQDSLSASGVYRSFALDTRRHLGIGGKYLSILATPDRWISWWPDAYRIGLRAIREQKINMIWSTYPIMTSHLIALSLSRISKVPWIADFRDPSPLHSVGFTQKTLLWIERQVMQHAAHSVFTTEGARRLYEKRFEFRPAVHQFSVIPNGYDEEVFDKLVAPSATGLNPLTLVHSGLLYRDGRNPSAFFRALAIVKRQGLIEGGSLRVVLRACGNESEYQEQLKKLALTDIVSIVPPLTHVEALQEQLEADGLLLFQGSEFNVQIPAKAYEYLRIGRPIFALVDHRGETASLLTRAGNCIIAPLTESQEIASALRIFLSRLRSEEFNPPDQTLIKRLSRRSGAAELARLFDNVSSRKT